MMRSPMPYEEPADPAPKALSASLTVRAVVVTLVAFLSTLAAKRYGLDIPTEVQEAIVAIGVSVAAIGMRRAVAGWLLVCTLALAGCHGPDLRPTIAATRQTLGALRADYARGRLTIPGAKEETLEALRKARVEEIDAADRALQAAEKSQ